MTAPASNVEASVSVHACRRLDHRNNASGARKIGNGPDNPHRIIAVKSKQRQVRFGGGSAMSTRNASSDKRHCAHVMLAFNSELFGNARYKKLKYTLTLKSARERNRCERMKTAGNTCIPTAAALQRAGA